MPINMKYCSILDIQRLPRGAPTELYPRRSKSNEYKKNINKLARLVEGVPWNMHKAASELRRWVDGSFSRPPLLDIDYVSQYLLSPRSPIRADARAEQTFDHMGGSRAVGLEPSLATVRISRDPPPLRNQVTAESEFVYTMAAELVQQHRFNWSSAIAFAEDCWRKFPGKQKKALKTAAKANLALDDVEDDNLHLDVFR